MLLGSLFPAAAGAEDPQPRQRPAEARAAWSDEMDRPLEVPFTSKGRWLWVRSPVAKLKRPVYRLQVEFPPGHRVRILQRQKMKAEIFQIPRKEVRTSLIADTISPSSSLLLEVTDPPGDKKRVRLSLRLTAEKTRLWTHRSCADERLFLRNEATENQTPFLYVAANCRREGQELNVTLVWSDDGDPGKISLSDLLGRQINIVVPDSGKGGEPTARADRWNATWMNFSLPLESPDSHPSLDKIRAPASLGDLFLKAPDDPRPESSFSIEWMPRRERRSWNWQAQLGLAAYSYSERAESLKVNQTAMTGQVSVQHRLQNSRFDFEGRMGASLFPVNFAVTSTDSSIPATAPRFYQGDADFGYLVPRAALLESTPNLRFFLGAQFWGMVVPENRYGVRLIMGPQIGARFFGEYGPQRRQWLVQTSFAPFSEKVIAVQTKSHKIDIRGAYELTGPMANHPVSLIGDLEWISMDFAEKNNGFQSFTSSVGLKMGF